MAIVVRSATTRRHGGFTLVEAAIATAIVGTGVVALLHALAAGTRVNQEGRHITQAVFLAQEVREWTLQLPFSDPDPGTEDNPPGSDGASPLTWVDDLDDLMNVTFTPPRVQLPRDHVGDTLYEMGDWSQTILMEWRDPNSLTTAVPPGNSDVVSVTVIITYKGREILTTNWLVTRRPS